MRVQFESYRTGDEGKLLPKQNLKNKPREEMVKLKTHANGKRGAKMEF